MKVTMLGCGSSFGVPEIGCACSVCTSTNPRNRRTRVSILIETLGKRLLVDTSPDLREQALQHKLNAIDAVLYTHDHADHVHGLDDLRQFNFRMDREIAVYADVDTATHLRQRFPYAFQPKPAKAWYRPSLRHVPIPTQPLAPFEAEGVSVLPILQRHAASTSLGFRIGNFAYSTDVNELDDEAFSRLMGLEVWIVDCLRYSPSYTHSRLENTLQWIERAKPKLAVLTHMSHEMDYDTLAGELPAGVVPGYDGLQLNISEPEE